MRRVRAPRHSLTGGRPKAGGHLSSYVEIMIEAWCKHIGRLNCVAFPPARRR